jgi:hypothetical protein
MKDKQEYIKDIVEIRSMMERSSRFLSLSGLSGVMAGIYALVGAYIAYSFLNFNPSEIIFSTTKTDLSKVFFLAIIILILALFTAIFLSYKNAHGKGEKIWNPTSRRLVTSMAVPLLTGGILVLILISKSLIGLIAPMTLIFYGIAIYNASKYTIDELKFLGLVQLGLGLFGSYFIEYGLLIWGFGFGIIHIVYGMYMYFRYGK